MKLAENWVPNNFEEYSCPIDLQILPKKEIISIFFKPPSLEMLKVTSQIKKKDSLLIKIVLGLTLHLKNAAKMNPYLMS